MTAPLDLLARAARLMHKSLDAVAGTRLDRPTPCTAWDLGALIRHVSDSITTLTELLGGVASGLDAPDGCAHADLELDLLLAAVAQARRDGHDACLIALTGAYELTVHAWDIDESTGRHRPLPADLVSTLLSSAQIVLTNVDRTGLFETVHPPAPDQRTDTDRLLALFGRRVTTTSMQNSTLKEIPR